MDVSAYSGIYLLVSTAVSLFTQRNADSWKAMTPMSHTRGHDMCQGERKKEMRHSLRRRSGEDEGKEKIEVKW